MARGRLALVTGAAGGVGRRVAVALAAAGADLALVDRAETTEARAALDAVAERCSAFGVRAQAMPVPGNDVAAAEAAARALSARRGTPAIVVLAARDERHRGALFSGTSAKEAAELAATNYLGQVALTLPLLPRMLAGSRIVSVTSATAYLPVPGSSALHASLAALDVWTRTVRVELHGSGVTAGVVRLPPTDAAGIARRCAITEREAAALVCTAIVSGRAVTGPWWSRALPGMLDATPRSLARVSSASSTGRHR